MLTLFGFILAWYFGFIPLFLVSVGLSYFFPRLFKLLFWLFTLPFFTTLGATLLTIIVWGYDILPLSQSTWTLCLLASLIPSFIMTNYISKDLS